MLHLKNAAYKFIRLMIYPLVTHYNFFLCYQANQCQFLSEELEKTRARYQELEDKFLDLRMKHENREVTIDDIGHHDSSGRRIMSVPPRDRLAINMVS